MSLFVILTTFLSALNANEVYKNVRVVHYNNENGLPQNTITAMAFDVDGFLWIGTEGGLVRFNGYTFEDKSDYISNPRIRMIFKSLVSDTLWVIDQNNAMYFIDYNDKNPVLYQEPVQNHYCLIKSKMLGHLLTDKDSCDKEVMFLNPYNFYVATDSSVYTFKSDGEFLQIHETYNGLKRWDNYAKILVVGDNVLYYTSDKSLSLYRNGIYLGIPKLVFEGYIGTESYFLDNAYFFNSNGKNLALLDDVLYSLETSGNQITIQKYLTGLPKINSVSSVVFLKGRNTFITGSKTDGLFIIDENSFRARIIDDNKIRTYTLSGDVNNIVSQIEISSGKVLANNGYIYDKNNVTKSDINDLYPYLFYKDSRNRIWACDKSNRLILRDSNLQVLQTILLGDLGLQMIEDSTDVYWLITNYNLFQINCKGVDCTVTKKIKGKEDLYFISLKQVNDSTLWLTTRKGILSYNKRTGRLKEEKRLGNYYYRLIEDVAPGVFWLGTYGNGFFLYRNDSLLAMPMDKYKYLLYTHSFLRDRSGFLWISTNKGLFQVLESDLLDFADKKTSYVYYHYYDRSYGFGSNEFNGGGSNSGLMLSDGTISLSSMNGLVHFHPDEIRPILPSSPIRIEKVIVDGVTYTEPYPQFELDPHFKRILVHINTVFFGHPNNLKLEYRINELDLEWQPVPDNNIISIPNIGRGEYKLEIRKLNGFGRNHYDISSLSFEVLPHFYERPIFYVLIFFTLILVVSGVAWLRIKILNNINNSLKEKVLSRTLELQKTYEDLEDRQKKLMDKQEALQTVIQVVMHDLSSPLRFLSRATKRLKNNIEILSRDELESNLEMMQVSSAQAEQFTKDLLIWMKSQEQQLSFEKQWISPSELIRQNILLYRWIADDKGIDIVVNEPENEQNVQIYADFAGIIIRNLLDNAVKYTHFGKITLQFQQTPGELNITISDTGIGFDSEVVSQINKGQIPYQLEQDKHLGFRLIFDALKFLNARLHISSKKGTGTTVQVFIPI